MNNRKFKRLVKKSLEESEEERTRKIMSKKSDLISLTNDDELMDRVLKKSAEMQEEILKQVKGE